MTETTEVKGRLCNQFIRNLCTSIIAEKHDLYVKYSNYNKLHDMLGLPLYTGKHKYNKTNLLNKDNLFTLLKTDRIDYNVNPNQCYFQTKDITQYLYNYIRTETVQQSIIDKNPYKERYAKNNDVFIHVRLGDITRLSLDLNYYKKGIDNVVSYDKVYISSDSIQHSKVLELQKYIQNKDINCELLKLNDVNTLQFGSTCKHIILSHGSFSAVIGWLGYYSNVYYPCYSLSKKKWFGDMCSLSNWNKIK